MTGQCRRPKTPTHLTQPQDAAAHMVSGNNVRESIQREIEKQRIRAEILAEEVARRRILEEEVWMELMLERQMALQRLESSTMGFDFYSRAPQFVPESSRIPQPFGHFEERSQALQPTMSGHQQFRFHGLPPFDRHPVAASLCNTGSGEAKPPSEPRKETVLAEPETNAPGPKAKVSTPVADHHGASDLNLEKKPDVWTCVLCHVSAPSENDLNQHLQGKKHRNKEAELLAKSKGSGTHLVNEECGAKATKSDNASGSTSDSSAKKAEKEHGQSSGNVGGQATQEMKRNNSFWSEKKQNNTNDKADSKSNLKAKAVDSVKIGEFGPRTTPLNVDPAKPDNASWISSNSSVKKVEKEHGKSSRNVGGEATQEKKRNNSFWSEKKQNNTNDKADSKSNLKAKAVDSVKIGESDPPTTPFNVEPAKPDNASWSTRNSSVKKAEKEHGKSSRNVGGEATQEKKQNNSFWSEKKQNNTKDKADSKSNLKAKAVDSVRIGESGPPTTPLDVDPAKPDNASGSTNNSSVKEAGKAHGKSSRNVGGEATQEKKQNNSFWSEKKQNNTNDKVDSKSNLKAKAVDSVKIGESGPPTTPLNVEPAKPDNASGSTSNSSVKKAGKAHGKSSRNVGGEATQEKKQNNSFWSEKKQNNTNDKAYSKSNSKAKAVDSVKIGESGSPATPLNVDPAKKFTFWCEMCQVGALTANVFADHENGKKHLAKLKECKVGSSSAAPMSWRIKK